FAARFGVDAVKFVNSVHGRQMNLRGLNAPVVKPGPIRKGDTVRTLREIGARPDFPLDDFEEKIIGVANDNEPAGSEAYWFTARADDVCIVRLQDLHQTIHVAHEELE